MSDNPASSAEGQSGESQSLESQRGKIQGIEKMPIETRSTADYLKDNKVSALGDIDINPAHTVVVISKVEERSRLRELEADGKFRRLKDLLTHSAVIVLVFVAVTNCLRILNIETTTEQDKEWARTTVSAIVGAGLGYAFGKNGGNG